MGFSISTTPRCIADTKTIVEEDPKLRSLVNHTNEPLSVSLSTRDKSGEMDGETQSVAELIEYFGELYNIVIAQKNRQKQPKKTAARPPFLDEVTKLKKYIAELQYPATWRYSDFMEGITEMPFMVKNVTNSAGRGKYVIENSQQYATFDKWMDRCGNEDEWLVQRWIQTPSDAPTSYRVIVDPTGDVVTSQIFYGPSEEMNIRLNLQNQHERGEEWKMLENPGSKYFLNSRSMTSNRMFSEDGNIIGGRITLGRREESHPYGSRDREILEAHDMDPQTASLPEKIRSVSERIGAILGDVRDTTVDGDLILGLDFAEDKASGAYNLLEVNRRPSMVSIRDYLGSAHAMTNLGAWRWYLNRTMARIKQIQASE